MSTVSTAEWAQLNQNYRNANNYRALTANMQKSGSAASSSKASYTSSYDNTCTDGVDDGEISTGQKILNCVKGIFNGAKNIVAGAIKHPIKTALVIGACCIPVVGPIIGAGLACYGIYTAGTKIAGAIAMDSYAKQVHSDAMAKDAWEDIGDGIFTAGVSVVGLKGSVGALKSQLGVGGAAPTSSTVQGIKDGSIKGVKEIAEAGAKETWGTFSGIFKCAYKKANEVKDKFSENKASEGGIIKGAQKTIKDYWSESKLGKRLSEEGRKDAAAERKAKADAKEELGKTKEAQQKAESEALKTKTQEQQAAAKKFVEDAKNTYGEKNVKVVKQSSDGVPAEVEISYKSGEFDYVDTIKYNADGSVKTYSTEQSGGTVIEKYKAGKNSVKESWVDSNGNTNTTNTIDNTKTVWKYNKTTQKYEPVQTGTKQTTTTVKNVEGKVLEETVVQENVATGYKTTQTTNRTYAPKAGDNAQLESLAKEASKCYGENAIKDASSKLAEINDKVTQINQNGDLSFTYDDVITRAQELAAAGKKTNYSYSVNGEAYNVSNNTALSALEKFVLKRYAGRFGNYFNADWSSVVSDNFMMYSNIYNNLDDKK